MKIGFIGLGQMGRGMASRLIDSGHQLLVWNRTRAAADVFAARGAVVAASPVETLASEVVITIFDIITGTSMNSPAYKNYGKLMLENPGHPTFPLKLGLKDVELALQTAADLAVPLPTAELLRDQHLQAIHHGYGECDWAALGTYLMDSAAGRTGALSGTHRR